MQFREIEVNSILAIEMVADKARVYFNKDHYTDVTLETAEKIQAVIKERLKKVISVYDEPEKKVVLN